VLKRAAEHRNEDVTALFNAHRLTPEELAVDPLAG
jgi:hypothetical protein